MTRPLVYVSGPLTTGDLTDNIYAARAAWVALYLGGCVPIAPHLWHCETIGTGLTYEEHMDLDLALLAKCDAVLRLDGDSQGADRECHEAINLEIPVYYTVTDVICDMTGADPVVKRAPRGRARG